MKTVAVQEQTFALLAQLKHSEGAHSFDELLKSLLQKRSPRKSMFGVLKGKTTSFTREERKDMWGNV